MGIASFSSPFCSPPCLGVSVVGLFLSVALPAQAADAPGDLVHNGSFEQLDAAGTLPDGWTTRHPDNVRVVDSGDGRGRIVEMTGDEKLMGTYGAELLGRPIPIQPNTLYRCTGLTKSTGPNLKVFVKGYATVTRRENGKTNVFDDVVYQMREDIPGTPEWRPFQLDFDIKPVKVFSDFQHRVEYVRIMLWSLWPAGTCWYDNVRFEAAGPVPEAERRHAEAMTHTGEKASLGPAAEAPVPEPDEEDLWQAAVNAWKTDQFAVASSLAQRLVEFAPHKGSYRLLAARAALKREDWAEAEAQSQWLLDPSRRAAEPPPAVEGWEQDWARIVAAEVLRHRGLDDASREMLQPVLATNASPHARQEAERLLGGTGRTP